jgi:hypothetical protein
MPKTPILIMTKKELHSRFLINNKIFLLYNNINNNNMNNNNRHPTAAAKEAALNGENLGVLSIGLSPEYFKRVFQHTRAYAGVLLQSSCEHNI